MQQSYQQSMTHLHGVSAGEQVEEQRYYSHNAMEIENKRSVEKSHFRQEVMYVHIEHFYCTLEEQLNPALHGQNFIVGTGTGRPNEPGRVIDVSPAAARLGLVSGMPLRRAHRIAPHTRFLPASYDHYQPVLRKLKEYYRTYSRIIESIPMSDAFIDLRGSESEWRNETPLTIAEHLQSDIESLGLNPMIGIATGKTLAELAALTSRKEHYQGVRFIPTGEEAAFMQTLPLSMLLKLRATNPHRFDSLPELDEQAETSNRIAEQEGRREQIDPIVMAELVAHLRDFGITTFAQVATLTEEGLTRRLGRMGSWIFYLANGQDESLVIPDAPPQSQTARIRFQHYADADETCSAIQRLAEHLSNRLREQRFKGQSIALILWPNRRSRETRRLALNEDGEDITYTPAEETIGGQMQLDRHTDAPDILAHHALMLFAHYHRSGMHYNQIQLRIGDIITHIPPRHIPQSVRTRPTRKLQQSER